MLIISIVLKFAFYQHDEKYIKLSSAYCNGRRSELQHIATVDMQHSEKLSRKKCNK
jgi:hypothetical protein